MSQWNRGIVIVITSPSLYPGLEVVIVDVFFIKLKLF